MNDQFMKLAARYTFGFAASLLLSVASYTLVTKGLVDSAHLTMLILLGLAAVQLIIQLICFLHLKFTGRARERTMTFGFTILMMLIIVIGSIWIMRNLDYRMGMSSEAMNEYMKAQNKKGF